MQSKPAPPVDCPNKNIDIGTNVSSDKMSLFFLPRDWQDTFSARGSVFLACIVAFETLSLVAPLLPVKLPFFKVPTLDHWAHLGGYLSGAVWAEMWKARRARREKKRREELGWLGVFFGK